MPHSSDNAVSASLQPIPSGKRAWNEPSITDEDVRNTAAKSTQATELATTSGPGS